jgi:P4 family phage/plasmid primase-like protien
VQGTKRSSQAASGDLARLNGMRFVAISEIDDGRHLEEAIVKSLTGGDPITARHLYKSEFVFTPVSKFWIATNHKPTIRGNDHGIWRRVRLIPFTRKFDKHEQDPYMESKLRAELPGILNWAIAGCLDWQKNRMPLPPVIENATKEYRDEMDILGSWLDQNCLCGPEYEVLFSDVYEDFSEWVKENYNITYAKKRLGQMLIERGYERGPQTNKRTYRGFELKRNKNVVCIVEYEEMQLKLKEERKARRRIMAKAIVVFSGITWDAEDEYDFQNE